MEVGMKALILSCNTGGGHNSAARAIAEEMHDRGDEAYVLDYLGLAGEGVSRLVGDGYVQIVKKTPRLFGMVYKLGMVISRLMRRSPVYYVNGRMAKYLDGYLKEHPVDVLVMPSSLSGRNHYLYEKQGDEAAPYSSGNDRLYLYSFLGGNGLRLLYSSS